MSQEWETMREKLAFYVWIELVIRQDCLGVTVGCLSRNLHSTYSQWYLYVSIEGQGMSAHMDFILHLKHSGEDQKLNQTHITGNWTKKDLQTFLPPVLWKGRLHLMQRQAEALTIWDVLCRNNSAITYGLRCQLATNFKITWAWSLNGRIVLIVLIDMGRPTRKCWWPLLVVS